MICSLGVLALCAKLTLAARSESDRAIQRLTELHNNGYFMQVCDKNATILHFIASDGGTDFSLCLVVRGTDWSLGN